MLVGVPKEIKDNEYRVGIVPSTVRELTDNGHIVLVEAGAGSGAGGSDQDYREAGAEVVSNADAVYGRADLIVKVKERSRRSARNCAQVKYCLHIFISRPIGSRPMI